MNAEYTAIVKEEGDLWIGWMKRNSGVNCQEHTREELMGKSSGNPGKALEFNRQDALSK